MDSRKSSTTKPLYRGTQAVWYVLAIIEVFLVFRFIFKLFAANSTANFTNFIYDVSYFFIAPFLNVFRVSKIEGNVFESTTILAAFVYWLIAWGLVRLFFMSKSVSTPEAADKLQG